MRFGRKEGTEMIKSLIVVFALFAVNLGSEHRAFDRAEAGDHRHCKHERHRMDVGAQAQTG